MSDQFYNQPARAARMFLIVGGLLIAVGVPATVFLWRHPHQPNVSMQTAEGFAIAFFCALPIGVGISLCGLLTLPAAMRASAIFREFEAGNYLARWKYDAQFWSEHVEGETRRLRKVSHGTFALLVVGGLLFLVIAVTSIQGSGRLKVIAGLSIAAGTLAVAMVCAWTVRVYSTNRCRRLVRCGEAIIAPHAAYIGGDLAFWGYGMRALQGARFVPGKSAAGTPAGGTPAAGTSAMIELIVGLNDAGLRATNLANVVSAAAGSAGYRSSYNQTQSVPVPPGDEAAARGIVRTLGELYVDPPQVAVTPVVPQSTGHPLAIEQPVPMRPDLRTVTTVTWETLPRRARRWWHIVAATALIGVTLFFAAVILDMNIHQPHPPTLGDSLAVWGLVLLIISVLFVPVATFKTLRARRRRRISIARTSD